MTRTCYRKTWKEFGSRRDKERTWLSFSQKWPSARLGRFWKRQLSKARRRYWKMTLRGVRAPYPCGKESEVNWKGW